MSTFDNVYGKQIVHYWPFTRMETCYTYIRRVPNLREKTTARFLSLQLFVKSVKKLFSIGNLTSSMKLTSLTTTNLASFVEDPLQLNYYQRLMTGRNLQIYLSLPMSSFLILPKPLTAFPMSGSF